MKFMFVVNLSELINSQDDGNLKDNKGRIIVVDENLLYPLFGEL